MKRKLSLFLAFSLLLSIFSTVFVLNTAAADDLNDHLLVNFDFEGATAFPVKDTSGKYLITAGGTANSSTIADGVVSSGGVTGGTSFLNFYDNGKTGFLAGVDGTLSLFMTFKLDNFNNFHYNITDSTTGRFLHRVQFNASGTLLTSIDNGWKTATGVTATVGTWYYYAVTLKATEDGIMESVYMTPVEGGNVMSSSLLWNSTNTVTNAGWVMPDLTALSNHAITGQFGRYQGLHMDDFRMYNCAIDAMTFGTLVEDLKAPATVADDLSDNVVGEFDFENPTAPLKDATGTNSLGLSGAAAVANGVVSTNGVATAGINNYLYNNNFKNMLSTVDSSFTTVIKFKLDSMGNNFNFSLNGNTNGMVYRIKFNASGMLSTSVGTTWNNFNGIVAEAGTWYYIVMSLNQTAAGITESVYLWPAEGGDAMGASKLWTGTIPTLANMKSDTAFYLGVGRYDPMHIEMLNFYNAYTNAHTVSALREYYALNDKPVTEITSEPKLGTLIAKFDFEAQDAPLKDDKGIYTLGTTGTVTTENGTMSTAAGATNYITLNDTKATLFSTLTDSVTFVMKVKVGLGDVFFRWWNSSDNAEVYRLKFEASGAINSSINTTWQGAKATVTVSADKEYYIMATLTQSDEGIQEDLYVVPAEGGKMMTTSKLWTGTLPDFETLATKKALIHMGRGVAATFDDVRFYNAAFTAEEASKLFEMMGGHAPVDSQAPEFVGVQLGEGVDGFNIRFVSVVNELPYATLGYKIVASWTENGEVKTKSLEKDCEFVYETLYGNDGGETIAYKAVDYAGKYFTAFNVYEVPKNLGPVTFTVTPYGTIETGDELGYLVSTKTVYGVTYEITYNNGSLSYKTIGTTPSVDEEYVPTESAPDNANTAAPLFQPAAGEYYNYCPSVMELEDGTRYTYYCTNGASGNITDYIAVRKGTPNGDGSYAWGAEQTVLAPTAGTWDARHVCDPSVIAGAFSYNGTDYSYLMAYLGCDTDFNDNEIGLAVATSPEGPF